MASSTLVFPCALAPTNRTIRRGISTSRRVNLRKLVRERRFKNIVTGQKPKVKGCYIRHFQPLSLKPQPYLPLYFSTLRIGIPRCDDLSAAPVFNPEPI